MSSIRWPTSGRPPKSSVIVRNIRSATGWRRPWPGTRRREFGHERIQVHRMESLDTIGPARENEGANAPGRGRGSGAEFSASPPLFLQAPKVHHAAIDP